MIILEGIYALWDSRIVNMMDLKVFVETDLDICLARRLNRDILHRGRELELSIQQWDRFVKPNFVRHIYATRNNANILTPRGSDNEVAINMITTRIRRQLEGKSSKHLNDLLSLGNHSNISWVSCNSLPCVRLLDQSSQVQAIHTILFNRYTPRDEFIFYFNRIATLLVSKALDEVSAKLPSRILTTPTNVVVDGVDLSYENLCAVTIIRGGQCFVNALRSTIPTIRIGRLLIQSDSRTGEPKLHSLNLPEYIDPKPTTTNGQISQADLDRVKNAQVLLVDTQLSSGAAATMATAILLDHGVQQENIVLVAYTATEISIQRLTIAFPNIKVVVARIDSKLLPRFIDATYFGTGQ